MNRATSDMEIENLVLTFRQRQNWECKWTINTCPPNPNLFSFRWIKINHTWLGISMMELSSDHQRRHSNVQFVRISSRPIPLTWNPTPDMAWSAGSPSHPYTRYTHWLKQNSFKGSTFRLRRHHPLPALHQPRRPWGNIAKIYPSWW